MGNYSELKDLINNPTSHGLPRWDNGDNEIEGEMMKSYLLAIVNSLSSGGYLFKGVAKLTPTQTDPGTPDQNVFYIASEQGTYTNFGGLVVENQAAVLKYNGSWTREYTGIKFVTVTQNTNTGGHNLKIGNSKKATLDNYFNVNLFQDRTTPFSSFLGMLDYVPGDVKGLGVTLTYLLSTGWWTKKFVGSNLSSWSDESSWRLISSPANKTPIESLSNGFVLSWKGDSTQGSFYDSTGEEVTYNPTIGLYQSCVIDVSNVQGKEILINACCKRNAEQSTAASNLFISVQGTVIEYWQQVGKSPVTKTVPTNAKYLLLSNLYEELAIGEIFNVGYISLDTIPLLKEELATKSFVENTKRFGREYPLNVGYYSSVDGSMSRSTIQNYHAILGFIKVTPNTIVGITDKTGALDHLTDNLYICAFDSNKTFVQQIKTIDGKFAIPSGVYYIGVTVNKALDSLVVYIASLKQKQYELTEDYKSAYRTFYGNLDLTEHPINGNVLVVGDSTIDDYNADAVASFLTINGTLTDISTAGDTISGQIQKYDALSSSVKQGFNFAFVQIGLNDGSNAFADNLANYQLLLTKIKTNAPTCKICCGVLNPYMFRLVTSQSDAYKTYFGRYENSMGLNNAIKRKLFAGIDYVADIHYELLQSYIDYLDTIYWVSTLNDGIHENNAARKIIACSWLSAIGII